ncbi:MAG: molybdenum cofactor guanylyltransferase [Woeseiaceae bacterium]
MTVPESLNGLVLAGGKSRRMGSDKAALLLDGKTQLEHGVELLQRHVEDVYVSTGADQKDDPVRRGFQQIVDRYENMGPIAGILSALDSSPGNSWLVLACDLPNIDDSTIRFLVENASPDSPFSAYRSVNDDLPEPLCAIYRPESRALIDQFVADGIVCPRKMLINSPTCLLEQPNPGALHNINTPEDLDGTGIDLAS